MKRRNFLMLLGSGTAAAAHTTSVPAGAGSSIQVQSPRTPLEIGSEKQLFLDDQVIESMEPRVFRLLNQPIKYRENPVIPLGTDWEQKGGLSHGGDAGTVFYDEDQKLYRFYGWMIEWPPQGGSYKKFLFYGESEDGLRWRKPAQGQVSYLGFDTNFLKISFLGDANPGNLAVLRDPVAKSQEERYKMVFQESGGESGGCILATQPMESTGSLTPWTGPSPPSTAIPTTT